MIDPQLSSNARLQSLVTFGNKLKEIDASFNGITAKSNRLAQSLAGIVQTVAGRPGSATGSGGSIPYSISPASTSASSGTWPGSPSGLATSPAPPVFSPGSTGGIGQAIYRLGGGLGGKTAAQGALGMALLATPGINDAMQYEYLASRQRFFRPTSDTTNGYDTSRSISKAGTPTSALDAAMAANASVGYGVLPGGAGYSSFVQGAAQISNLYPGVGLTGGVGAMGALNQPRNVNLLRMVGVQVRTDTGLKDFSSIVDQVYNLLKTSAGTEPTIEMISLSSLPGNALDSFLTQYFGNDDDLKFSVLFGLIQKVKSGGKTDLSKQALVTSGGTTKTISSFTDMASAQMTANQRLTPYVTKGIRGANVAAAGIMEKAGKQISSNKALRGLVTNAAFLDAFGGMAGGSGALLIDAMMNIAAKGNKAATKFFTDALGLGPTGSMLTGVAGDLFGQLVLNEVISDLANQGDGKGGKAGQPPTNPWAYYGADSGPGGRMGGTTPNSTTPAPPSVPGGRMGGTTPNPGFARPNLATVGSGSGVTINVTVNGGSYRNMTALGESIGRTVNVELATIAAART